MVSLLLLKQFEDLRDELIIRWWVDIPYWQYLSGEKHFQWKSPAASSDLIHFRKRIGKKGAERLLKLSIELFNPKIQKEEVVIDTTVQEKKHHLSHRFQTGQKSHWHLQEAKQEGISLRQSYSRVTPPTPSSGIEPEKSAAENKSQEGNPETANHRSCPGSWTGPQDAPKTNQSLCPNPVGCLKHPASEQNR